MAKYRMKGLDGRLVRTGSRTEALAVQAFTAEGWQVLKRGWPDFLVVRNEQVRLIEVKRKEGYKLKRTQGEVSEALRRLGLIVEIWAPPAV